MHLPFWLLFGTACAGPISTWWYEGLSAPQVAMYDSASGNIFYSLCNSDTTPIFPGNETAAFALDSEYPPLNGTSVAGIGYQTSDAIDIAVIIYQTKSGAIIQSQWQCNSTSGLYSAHETSSEFSWDISSGLVAAYNKTGLAIINLGDADDTRYRVYFKDGDGQTVGLRYVPDDAWYYDGVLTPDVQLSLELSAGHQGEDNITVMSPSHSDANWETIEFCNLANPGTFDIDTFPARSMLYNSSDTSDDWWGQITNNTETTGWLFGYREDVSWTLDAFDGEAASVAIFVSSNLTENVFYIGTDTSLHGVSGYNASWDKSTTQDNEKWPLADDASAPLALTYDSASDRVWIYYMSDGNLTQVYRSDAETWEDSITLSKSVNVTETATTDSGSTGLSTSGKIGVGVSIGAGAIVFAGIAFVFFWQRRSRQTQGADADVADPSVKDPSNPAAGPLLSPLSVPGSPAPAYLSGYWVNGQWVPPQTEQPYSYYDHSKPENRIAHEMWAPPPGAQPMYELPHEERTHEMPIEGHQVAEMPTEVQSISPQDPAAPGVGAQQSSGSHLDVQQHMHEPDAAEMQHARLSAITPEPAR